MEAISYFNALLADPRITMLQMLDMQRPLEVARVYVPLRLSEEHQRGYDAPVSDEESTEATIVDDPDVWIVKERQRRERSAEVIYDPEKAIHTFPRCVIMGGPGVGKTTLLRHLAIMAAQRSIAGMPALLPVYVELQSFVRSGLHDLLDFVSTTWEGAYAFPAAELRLLLANYLDEGRALLLLDALDEAVVGEAPEAAQQSYEAVSQAILAIAAGYPKASIVATIRKASYRQQKPLVGFTALEVMDLRFEDVKQFVYNWYNAADDLHAEEKSADLIKRLDANPRLRAMAANPLLLTLIVLAYEDETDAGSVFRLPRLPDNQTDSVLAYGSRLLGSREGMINRVPTGRAELYRVCIETLLTKEGARRGIRGQWELTPEQKHQLLRVLAWHFHRKRQRYFTEHDLLRVIAEFLPGINVPAERNNDVLQEIESEQGVLKEQAAGWHGFVHLSLQEYFAAEYINDRVGARFIMPFRLPNNLEPQARTQFVGSRNTDPAPAELLRHRADSWWEEVLLLYMGITPDASLFLQQLYSQDSSIREDIFYTNVLLAGRCLTARPIVGETGLRAQIIEGLFELLMSTQYSLLRQEAIKVVCSIGVFETNSRLVTLLSDEQLDVPIRWNIADALGRLGERSVANELVRLLADERLHAFVRWNIADALGMLGERSVAADLVRLLSDEQMHAELRRGIADALGRLGERSVATDLVQLLADEQQDMFLRRSIASALGRLAEGSGRLGGLERSVASDLVQLLSDERLNVDLRRSIADALGALGERSVAADLVQLLADEQQDVDLRRSIADALGMLGEWSVVANAMVQLLADEQQDVFVRRRITGALGTLAEVSGRLVDELEGSVAGELAQLLTDEWLDAELRMSIADALGMLGERSVVAELVQLLADDQLDVNVRRAIAIALGRLGERLVAARALVRLLSDERLDAFMRRSIADALGRLAEGSGRLGG